MKKLSVLLMVLLSMSLQSQTWMQIEKISGGKDSVKLTDITKIYFTTTPTVFVCGTSTIDYSGKTYHTVQIGTQCWMKANLDIGTMINVAAKPSNNGTIEKYCYENNIANCTTYGGLYNWDEAMAYSAASGATGICPSGWHVPTNSEFETLAAAVGNNSNALKAIGQGTASGSGTNTSGFSALLAGFHGATSIYYYLGTSVFFMSSTVESATYASGMRLYHNENVIHFDGFQRIDGISIRCLKD